jgi:4,5-DOPA dioxygenase extradiol
MPIGFVGHGAPTNAIQSDGATAKWRAWGAVLPRPAAVLVLSAHWLEQPPRVGGGEILPLIYDFTGFPEELYRIFYPAPGAPDLAEQVMSHLRKAGIAPQRDAQRGLDHGAWVPLRHMFPEADVPVLQVSIPFGDPGACLALGRALAPLRKQDVFILGSGNIVHNLRHARLDERDAPVDPWAAEFDEWCAGALERNDLDALADYARQAPGAELAVPTDDHYAPLLITAAAAAETGRPVVRYPYTGFEHGNLSMRCVEFIV